MQKTNPELLPTSLGLESWRKIAGPAIKRSVAWYFYAGLIIAVFAPRALVSEFYFIQVVIDLVGSVVPALSKFIAISDFPEVTGFYFAVMWLLMPIPTILVAFRWPLPPHLSLKHAMTLLVLGPVGIAILLMVFFVLPIQEGFDLSYRRGQGIAFLAVMSQYRLALGDLGSMALAVLATFVGVWIKFVWASVLKLAMDLRKA